MCCRASHAFNGMEQSRSLQVFHLLANSNGASTFPNHACYQPPAFSSDHSEIVQVPTAVFTAYHVLGGSAAHFLCLLAAPCPLLAPGSEACVVRCSRGCCCKDPWTPVPHLSLVNLRQKICLVLTLIPRKPRCPLSHFSLVTTSFQVDLLGGVAYYMC